MSIKELKAMFPNYHPEDYIMSIADCCGSCGWGEHKTYCINCHRGKIVIEMFPYGYCPQYVRNPDIKMPIVVEGAEQKLYGKGHG